MLCPTTAGYDLLSVGYALHLQAQKILEGIFVAEHLLGIIYTLDEAETKLAYKAHCIDEGRTCSLLVADLEKDTPPTLLAARVGAFEFAPGGLAVITSRPAAKLSGKLFFSLGTVPLTVPQGAKTAPITVLDDQVAGDFVLVGEGGKRIAYVIDEPGREGVGIVNLPSP
jgi:hypothetical protein